MIWKFFKEALWPFKSKPEEPKRIEYVHVCGEWKRVYVCHCGHAPETLFFPEVAVCPSCGCIGQFSEKIMREEWDVVKDHPYWILPSRINLTRVEWNKCSHGEVANG